MEFKKGDTVTLQERKGSGTATRQATVTQDGLDSKGRVRLRPAGYPMDISVTTEPNDNVYVLT